MSAFTEANRKAFDDLAASYGSKPWQVKLSKQVSDALQARKDWLGVQWAAKDDGRDVRLLDYACGTGAITKSLGPYVNTIRGIDISAKMVEHYNEAARSSGLTPEQAHAVVGDLLTKEEPTELLKMNDLSEPFDIAVIGLGFHHFESPKLALERLRDRLKSGTGVLVIVDFKPFSHEQEQERKFNERNPGADFPDMAHTIKHDGFNEEQMRSLYESTGFDDFGYDVLPEPAVMEWQSGTKERTIFIAKGTKR